MFRGRAQERDHVGGAAERVGDGPAVDQRDGGPARSVDLGPEPARAGVGLVEYGETLEHSVVGSTGGADEDAVHVATQCRASPMLEIVLNLNSEDQKMDLTRTVRT
jgi:hypothetical protein